LEDGLLRIGDAAVAMDPLSGHGLFWALASALHAVPLAQAMMDGETDLAQAFYRDRVVGTFWRQARVGRDFYRVAGLEGPFWQSRRNWPDDLPAETPAPDSLRIEPRVIVRDGRLARADVLVTRAEPDGVAFVHGVEIAPVLARLDAQRLPDRAVFAARVLPEVPPVTAANIYDWLQTRGVPTGGRPEFKEVMP
jgi:hypothetical protein